MTIDVIFAEALTKNTPAERTAYLDEVCANDLPLRQRVETLLQSHEQAGDFLAKPAIQCAAEELAGPACPETTQAEARVDDGGPESLDFLASSDKPDSQGRLGHYEVQEVVGRGGMGIVLRAFDEKLHRIVAIKVMAAQLATNATARKRFTREAQAAAAVTHDHIVTIHAVEEGNGLPYLVMQYVSGMSLQQRLDRSGPLELREIVRIGMQTAAGLAAAHAHGLIHRDIKPANILLENGVERVKITDFGLARAVADASLTQSGVIAGTPQFMSPEQARGEGVDQRTDLFSVGSVIYAMCTGRPPFRADSSMAVLKRVCDDTPRPIRETNSEIPDWLVAIVTKLHAKNPADRFQSATEVAELLKEHLAHLQHPSVVPLPAMSTHLSPLSRGAEGEGRSRGKRRRMAMAAAVLLCLIGGLSLTEATGVTSLRATVIRIFTPEGTLVVEVDDPGVKVTIEGDGGIVITGAGLHVVGLKPGSYKVQAAKDGKPVRLDQELVTITRGDKQVVRVRLEGEAATAKIAAKLEPGAFVLLGGKGVAERKFDTLADAVQGASGGDTIEVRGNGPFMSEPINISRTALTIRAGAGFRPVFVHTTDGCLLTSRAPLALEGLEFRSFGNKVKEGQHAVIQSTNAPLRIAHCRIWVTGPVMDVAADYSPLVEVRHSDLLAGDWGSFMWTPQDGGKLLVDNCLMSMIGVEERKPSQEAEVELSNNTFVARDYIYQHRYYSDPVDSGGKGDFRSVRVKAARNVFSCPLAFGVLMLNQEGAKPFRPDALADWCRGHNIWEASENLFDVNGEYLFVAEGILEGAKKQRVCKTIKDWQTFWKADKAPGIDAAVRFVGGDLIDRVSKKLPSLTPKDFRLRPDSPGHKAGKDGKDLGADVDLVGPGPAYERWKKTPEYQQWLTETKQVK